VQLVKRSIAVATALVALGCSRWAALDTTAVIPSPDDQPSHLLPDNFLNHGVPRLFSRNLGPNCGLISLQMALAYQGIQTSFEQLVSRLGSRTTGGAIHLSELVEVAQQYDVLVLYVHEPTTYQLRALVAAQFAPLVASRGYGPNTGHARVLVGYQGTEDQTGLFYLLDPNYGRMIEEPIRKYVLQAHQFALLILGLPYTRAKVIGQLAPFFGEGQPLPEIRTIAKQ